jgi:type I restriction enzyme S subunit
VFVTKEKAEELNCYAQKGDLLFSRANTREMVGATAVIFQDYPELILPDKLWKIRFDSRTNVLYMKHILSHKSGGAICKIGMLEM